jgi:mRNA interferase MazF
VIRGAVYRIDLGRPRGHEQGGRHLGLVVSPSDSLLSVVTVIPTSTSAGPSVHRPELEIGSQATRMLVDQSRSIDVTHVAGEPVNFLNRDEFQKSSLPWLGTSVSKMSVRRDLSRRPVLGRLTDVAV